MTLPTKDKIIKEVEGSWEKLKALANLLNIDKGGLIVMSIFEAEKGEHKHFIRCENCILYECEALKTVKKDFPQIVEIWVTHGCQACPDFSPKPDAEGQQ